MSIIKDLESFPGHKVYQYLTLIGLLICPFYVFLFLFCRNIFLTLNPISLIILSMSLSVPVLALNVFLAAMVEHGKTKIIKNVEVTLSACAFLTTIFLFIFILIEYFMGSDAKQVIRNICTGEFFVIFVAICMRSYNKTVKPDSNLTKQSST